MDQRFSVIGHSQLLNIVILKFNSPVLLNQLGNIFPYCPVDIAIQRINSSSIDLAGRKISVLWLKSGYTMKYSLSPQEIPWASPSGLPLGSGYISLYISPLVTIQIQYFCPIFLPNFTVNFEVFKHCGVSR